ncbi:MAG: EAL domain-containing protein [Campylobacterota bacterium]
MKTLNLKFFMIILLLVGVFYLAINLKKELDYFNKNYNYLISETYKIKYNWNEHLSKVRDSIIFLHYNNDNIIKEIKKNEAFLNSLENKKEYKNTFERIDDYKIAYENSIETIYKFLRINAKVKNSLIYLENQIRHISTYEKEYANKLAKIVSEFVVIKSSLNSNMKVSKELYDYFNAKSTKEITDYHLNFLHIDVLYENIPKLEELFTKLSNSKLNSINNDIFTLIDQESKLLKEKIEFKFYLVLMAYIVSILIIIYYVDKSRRDTSNILRLKNEKQKSLLYDDLTGLLNRASYSIDSAKDDKAVILIDIIDFSKINSMIGYEGGDFLLKDIAKLLSKRFKKVYRVGVDHFVILFKHGDTKKLESIARDLIVTFDENRFVYRSIEIPVSINIGISNKKSYLKNAEVAISKSQGSFQRVTVYKDSMNESQKILENFNMLSKVKVALENDSIRPFFQPIVDLKTREITRYEALVRLIDEEKIVSPFFFLDITKKSKLYPSITKIVVKKSLEFIRREKISVSVNLSYQDIIDYNTMSYLSKIINENKDISKFVTFEILESDEISNYEYIYSFIEEFKEYGCKIAIDDFGSGYSNFTELFNMNPDILKIDGSLIRDIHRSENSRNIVKAMVDLSLKSGIKTVAEFVDDEEVHTIIRELGVDYGQGFLYGKPTDIL